MTGRGIEVPIYLKEDSLDLQCIFLNRLYRSSFHFCSRSTHTHQLTMNVPKGLKKVIEFIPKVAYIQPGETMAVQVKIQCDEEGREKLLMYTEGNQEDKEAGFFTIRGTVEASDQALPVHYAVQLHITPSTLLYSPSSLSFSNCPLSHQKVNTVIFENPSPVLQQLVFDESKLYRVLTDDGFINLMPYRKYPVNIAFTPTAAIDYKFNIIARTKVGEVYKIEATGVGIHPPVVVKDSTVSIWFI